MGDDQNGEVIKAQPTCWKNVIVLLLF